MNLKCLFSSKISLPKISEGIKSGVNCILLKRNPKASETELTSNVLGSEILDEKRHFKFIKGPIFSNIILADEINRTPPKTQAALLEAMQERSVTVSGNHYKLDLPFFVLATQNPIEQEGTYPLPEAQLDRFMFSIYLGYPSFSEEVEVVKSTTANNTQIINSLFSS